MTAVETRVFDYVRANLTPPPPVVDIHDYLPHHRPPQEFIDGTKSLWILEGGRGGGKTYSAAVYYNNKMRAVPGTKGRIIAPTIGEALQSCVTGTSGLLTLYPELKLTTVASTTVLRWPNGSEAAILGGTTDRDINKMRAVSNRTLDWFEEFTSLKKMERVYRQAATGRRIGQPQALITTTPTAHPFWAKIREFPNVVRTFGTMFDNPHLSEQYKQEILDLYAGTSLEGQEIYGQILTDVDGALWNTENLHEYRIGWGQLPELVLRYIGIDPAVESGTTGIVAAGSYIQDDVWNICALGDYSLTDADPLDWAMAALLAAVEWDVNEIVAERNQGGKMVESTLKIAKQTMYEAIKSEAENLPVGDPNRERLMDRARFVRGVKIHLVRATDGKHTRAQPIALLHEQGRGHIVGKLNLLENELTTWVEGDDSPDRLDAYVWAATRLVARFRRGRSGMSQPVNR